MSLAIEQTDVTVAGLHAARHVSEQFENVAGELQVSSIPIETLVERYGSPLYLYSEQTMLNRLAHLKRAYTDSVDVYYSIKANPHRAIARRLVESGCGIEIASSGELHTALKSGCSPERILFAGPGKTLRDLTEAVHYGIHEIHVESVGEAQRLSAIGRQHGRQVRISLRVNPTQSAQGGAMRMGGKPTPFGIDEEQLNEATGQILKFSHVKLVGVHLFTGTQILDSEILLTQYRHALSVARTLANRIGRPLETIDFGGGLGVPYFSHEQPLDLHHFACGFTSLLDEIQQDAALRSAQLIIEPGRFLVAESGLYVTKVTDVKTSRGKTFVVVDGGMHHHLAASGNLGQTIKRNFPIAVLNKLGTTSSNCVDVVGPLCTPLDTLARDIMLPELSPGDLIGIFNAGAYARTSSPLGFLSHPAPPEVLIDAKGHRLIRRRGKPSDLWFDQTNDQGCHQHESRGE